MGSIHKLRKVVGVLKDSTTVSLAKVNSGFSELDVAIVKATNHVEAPPGERHVRKIFASTSIVTPRADVAYCIHALARRLNKTRNWMVAIKVLIVIHRLLREGDPTFREELMNYSHKARILNIANFKDDSTPHAWDCSAWTRTYALFLEGRLECFRILKFDIETERLSKACQDETKVHGKTKCIDSGELLEQLLALQHLLYRLLGCKPEGAACRSYLIQYALSMVLKESFKIYCAINDGIINLVDRYFEMTKYDAVNALHIYKRAGEQADLLSEFYDFCKRLELGRNFQFPRLRQPPPSFRATMEEYVKEAPQKRLEYNEEDELSHKEELEEDVQEKGEVEESKEPESTNLFDSESFLFISPEDDLLGLNEIHQHVAIQDESNQLALTIVHPGNDPQSSRHAWNDLDDTNGWELALVTTPSNTSSHVTEAKLAGGFDKLLLDNLYEAEAVRMHKEVEDAEFGYGSGIIMQNPFEQQQDVFTVSSGVEPLANVQMATVSQQQQVFQQPQIFEQSLFQYQSQNPQRHSLSSSSSFNPFGDPF